MANIADLPTLLIQILKRQRDHEEDLRKTDARIEALKSLVVTTNESGLRFQMAVEIETQRVPATSAETIRLIDEAIQRLQHRDS